jgi:hypothetical protein
MRLSKSFLKKTVLNKRYRLERLMDDEDSFQWPLSDPNYFLALGVFRKFNDLTSSAWRAALAAGFTATQKLRAFRLCIVKPGSTSMNWPKNT